MTDGWSERRRRKREAILEAATELFLSRGYASTSMEDIAAAAAASKQTLYKHFGDKETLFRAIVMGGVTEVGQPFQQHIRALLDAADVPTALRALAHRYVVMVLDRDLVRRRQLVVREAGRLPDLARAYYECAPARTMAALADLFAGLSARGELRVDDPEAAASHFAFLVLGRSLDKLLFCGADEVPERRALTQMADAGVDVFLAAYRLGPKALAGT